MKLRNVAIIAHVDHGKTTLVDRLLQQSGVYRDNQRQVERAMDSNDLERERGITILAKAASIDWDTCNMQLMTAPCAAIPTNGSEPDAGTGVLAPQVCLGIPDAGTHD